MGPYWSWEGSLVALIIPMKCGQVIQYVLHVTTPPSTVPRRARSAPSDHVPLGTSQVPLVCHRAVSALLAVCVSEEKKWNVQVDCSHPILDRRFVRSALRVSNARQ